MEIIIEESISSKIYHASKWSAISEVVTKLSTPIISMILARLIAPEAFGVVATIAMLFSFVELISEAGFSKYLIQNNFSSKKDLYIVANISFFVHLIISFVFIIIIFFFKDLIADAIGSSGMGILLVVSSFQLLVTSFSGVQIALFKRAFDFKSIFIGRLIVSVIPFFITVPLAFLGYSYWSIVIGTMSSQLINTIFFTLRSSWKPSANFKYPFKKEMIKYSMWSMVESISIWLSVWIDIFIISRFLNTYYLGLYKTSINMVSAILSIFSGAVIPPLFSSLSRIQNDHKQFSKVFLTIQSTLAYLLFPIGFGLFIFKDLATTIFFGSNWNEASYIVGIWSLTTVFKIIFSDLNSEAYRAKGLPKISFLLQISHLIFLVPAILISVRFGFEQLVLTRALIRFQLVLTSIIIMSLIVKVRFKDMIQHTFKPIIYSVIMSIFSVVLIQYSSSMLWNFLVIALSAFFYILMVLIFSKHNILDIIKYFKGGENN